MAIQDDNTILSKQDLKEYHNRILPYLGGNMMMSTNNSDYYSTDEKVVGVWTDGKPVYQKTFITTSPSAINTSKNISIGANIDKGFIMYGSVDDGLGNLLPLPFSTNAGFTTPIRAIIINNSSSSNKNTVQLYTKSESWLDKTTYFTIQYTKTTDTASTALTTPGAYDINFPNTWKENTEIYFGNGLYGYRAKGNFTATSTGSSFTLNLVANAANFTIVNTGGSAKVTNAANSTVMRMFGVNWSPSDGKPTTVILIDRGTNNYLRFQVMFVTDKATTSNTYDVWVTYTK